ncbi:TetR/AcrR family transcriptional regulator [Streptomyces sp. NPDC001595]|uniref:TetR/AcrR family transcriptional regulator n=1 Tax=Streptomyces sp. NPDC001532 TaxID=3154520 RepID=UPI00331A4817
MTSDDTVPAPLRRLWRLPESSRLGRPATLGVDLVVTTAVEIADRDGLDGVTLPKVAKSLGFTGMSLYRYVGSKDELLALMGDHALGAPPACLGAGDWREGLRAWARAQRVVYQQRPWLTRLPVTGPPSGPRRIAWMEAALAILARTPLDWAHKLSALALIGGYVVQSVRQESEFTAHRAEGQGQADAERAWGRALAGLVDPGRFPQTARLLSSAMLEEQPADPSDPAISDTAISDAAISDADFSVGLELILDGIATRIERAH